jgi:hypothetical protein
MPLSHVITEILSKSPEPLTPRAIAEKIKETYPDYYGTDSAQRAVDAGHHATLEGALTGWIYGVVRSSDQFICDTTQKPMRISLSDSDGLDEPSLLEDPEAESGMVYVLKTGLFTESGKEVVKIGVTTQPIDQRIQQLYSTGVPCRFTTLHTWETKNFYELERALHKLLAPFRLSTSKEFFTSDCLPFAERIFQIHSEINNVEQDHSANSLHASRSTLG